MAQSMLKGMAGPSGLSATLPSSRKASSKQVTRAGNSEEIYIGFPKTDYARPPGRKGRVIKDDPRKYPGREDLGILPSVVGGWAGGEAGLWQFREQIEAEKSSSKPGSRIVAPSSPLRPPAKNKWGAKTPKTMGKDPIYVGFGKDELELRKSGAQGRVIYDDANRYPGREDLGFLPSVVGGFAGGEAGLRGFTETGELRLRKPGDPTVKKQFSPLSLAFLVIFAVAGGGVLLTTALGLADADTVEAVTEAAVSEAAKVATATTAL